MTTWCFASVLCWHPDSNLSDDQEMPCQMYTRGLKAELLQFTQIFRPPLPEILQGSKSSKFCLATIFDISRLWRRLQNGWTSRNIDSLVLSRATMIGLRSDPNTLAIFTVLKEGVQYFEMWLNFGIWSHVVSKRSNRRERIWLPYICSRLTVSYSPRLRFHVYNMPHLCWKMRESC